MRKLQNILLLALLTVGTLTGCRSQKGAVESGGYTPAADASLAQRYADLCDSYAEWTDVEMPVRVDLAKPARFGMGGRAYMRRGEYVYISLRMMGFEVAVMQIDADSIRLADKYHKKYISEDIRSLLGATGLTIADLQDALLGRAFEVGSGTVKASAAADFSMTAGADAWQLVPRSQPRGASYGFTVGMSPNALTALAVEVDGHTPALAAYSNPLATPAGTFCRNVDLSAAFGGQDVAASLEWDLRSARWNSGVDKQWKQPSASYQRIPASQLLKSIRL